MNALRTSARATARRCGTLVLVLAVVVLSACTRAESGNGSPVVVHESGDPSGYLGAALPEPYVMPDVTLQDDSGQAYNLRTTPTGPVTLLFFGYSNCPDVCIGVLSDLANALNRMDPPMRDQVTVVFVTTDPARDDGPTVRDYLDRFDPRFVGLTGDLETIKQLAGGVGVDIEGMEKLPSGGYEVGHGAHVIGFGKDMTAPVLWTPSTPVGDLRHDFSLLVERQQG